MIQLVDAVVMINNEAIAIMPNSLKYTEGRGEQMIRAASVGDGEVEQIYSRDVETAFSDVMFDLPSTPENIELALSWKDNRNLNVVAIQGSTDEGTVTRTFTKAAVTSNYEVGIGTEAVIPIEFMSNAAI